jgi:hypothetical protein
MKLTTIAMWAMASVGASGAFAQNGAGSGPPINQAPGPKVIVPSASPVPLLLPFRIAGVSVQVDSLAIIDTQRRAVRRAAARSGRQTA